MIKTTPFHPRLSELNTTGLYGHWSGHLSAAALHRRAEARVLRGPQQRRRLRHLAALQVLDPGPRRRALARRRLHPRHPHLPARPRAVHDLVRRPRVRDGGRRGVPPLRQRVLHDRGPAQPRLPRPTSSAGSRVEIEDVTDDYGILAIQGPRSRELLAGLTADIADLRYFELTETKIGGLAGHGVPHRLHRRPRLRDHRRRATRRSTCWTRSSRPGRRTACARSARTR